MAQTPFAQTARRVVGPILVSLTVCLWIAQLFTPDEGLEFVTGLVVYLITWWTVLFAILPLGVRGQHETGEIAQGSEPGAPADPQLRRKAWLTTQITAAIWLIIFAVLEFRLIDLDAIPFLPRFE